MTQTNKKCLRGFFQCNLFFLINPQWGHFLKNETKKTHRYCYLGTHTSI